MSGQTDYRDVAYIDVEKKQLDSRNLVKGDIVIEKSGGSLTQAVGRVIYFDKEEKNYSFSNFCARLRLNKKHKGHKPLLSIFDIKLYISARIYI